MASQTPTNPPAPPASETPPAPPASETPPAPPAPPAPPVEAAAKPAFVRLRAVHGRIIHPFTVVTFDTDIEVKHDLDSWCDIQIKAGKLVVVD